MGWLASMALQGRSQHPRACRAAIFAAAAGAMACSSKTPPPQSLVITLFVEGDPGIPLAHAQVLYGGKEVGTTSADGTAKLTLGGDEGQSFDLSVQCPEGYKSPSAPVTVTLKRLAEQGKSPRYESSCRPTLRQVVVAITADSAPNLPVLYLGSEVARTDASGAAHVLLRIPPGEQFSVTLATTDKGAEALRPRNPVATFTVGDRDEVFVFDPHFTVDHKRRIVSRPRVPTEVGGH
jgi:hypothetical protein